MLMFKIIFMLNLLLVHCENCIKSMERSTPEYYLMSMCQKSKLKVLASNNYYSIDECKKLAIRSRAMAFNYSPTERNRKESNAENPEQRSCMVLACPEIEKSTSIQRDFKYDYYSIFTDPLPPMNATCIESTGMFVFHQLKLNYTASRQMCRSFGADLADVGTETRTAELSKVIPTLFGSDSRNKMFYVGMDDLETEGEYVRSNGVSIKCSTFRAWAPGHPKNRRSSQNCVALDKKRMWQVVDCDKKYSFICEIFPGGKYDYYDDYYGDVGCFDYES